jgi:uncharacterized membrane protein YfcA
MINPYYALSGLIVGLLVGVTGVGGGSLMTPLLVLLFKFHPATAVGTDLLYAAISKSGGTLIHGMRKTIDWRITGLLAAGSVPATAFCIGLLAHYDRHSIGTSGMITTILGGALMFTALVLLYRSRILTWCHRNLPPASDRTVAILTVVSGALLGIMVSLSSVGAGAVGVTMLVILYPKVPVSRLVGTDIAHSVPLAFIAGMGHWVLGDINVPLLLSLLVGSLPGIMIGSYYVVHLPERLLRQIMAVTLILVAGRLVWK